MRLLTAEGYGIEDFSPSGIWNRAFSLSACDISSGPYYEYIRETATNGLPSAEIQNDGD
jgi:hypothetical protein